MNFSLTRDSFRHTGGSKDYHLALLESVPDGEAIVMMRFGKRDQHGQIKFERRSSGSAFILYWEKLREKRDNRGYVHELETVSNLRCRLPLVSEPITYGVLDNYFTRQEYNALVEFDATNMAPFFALDKLDVFATLPDLSNMTTSPTTQKPKINPMDDPQWGQF